jgi:cohesin loading factor subunit SCC2
VQNNDLNKLTLKISKKNTSEVVKVVPSLTQDFTIGQMLNDDTKIEEKFSQNKNEYKIKSNKFYASKETTPSKPPVYNPSPSHHTTKPTQSYNTPSKGLELQQNKNFIDDDKIKRKIERNKVNLATWQPPTDTTTTIKTTQQADLPSDFTPELIAQLASEGYDVSSGRKASRGIRTNQPAPTTSIQIPKNFDVDDDDDDDEEDNFDLKIYNKMGKMNKNRAKPSQKIESLSLKRENDKQQAVTTLDLLEHPTEHPSYKKFTQIIDDLFESYDKNFHNKIKLSNLNNDEIIDEYLINTKLCSELSQEAYKLNTYSLVSLIKKSNLIKLQTILYFNIKDGIKQMDLNDDLVKNDQEKLLRDILFDKFIRAADSSITSLYLMTAEKINKEIIMEDLIEQISLFSKLHLTTTIFPHYDSIYRSNNFDASKSAGNLKRTKLNFNASNGGISSGGNTNPGQKIFKYIQHFYNRLREILNLIGDLIQIIDLTDTIIITLSSMCIMCFFVDNINEIQLEAMKILTNIFSKYEKHRQLIFDDILSSLAKLHSNKRNLRSYKCLNNEMIQMVSALSLQLIQCEVSCLNETTKFVEDTNNNDNQQNLATISFEEKETFLINTYENSSLTAKKFLSVFFHKCKSKQNEFDFRPIFDNFIQDLLITVNKPEWPASELILNMLGVILVNQINYEQNDVASRVNSLEYLGQIVSTLRKDALETHKNPDKLKNVFKKIVSSNEKLLLLNYEKEINFDNKIKNAEIILELQKTLISYLDSLEINDTSIQYSKRFFIAQWLKEININGNKNEMEFGEEQVEKYTSCENQRKELYALTSTIIKTTSSATSTTSTTTSSITIENVLDFNDAFLLCKYLCSLKKSLDKNFDYYLVNILNLLGGSNEINTPTQVRSKAIKCLSLVIEADAQILLKQKVFTCVQANFLHQTISVREAAVDLIGRFITLRPELTKHYYNLLSDRILDVGVSVRKRVIKIFRDICINQPKFEHIAEICVKILRRINDEDGIKKLVIDTFYNLWFIPIQTNDQLLLRVLNIVDVISEFSASSNIAQSTEFFEQLFSFLISNTQQASSSDLVVNSVSKEMNGDATHHENQMQKTNHVLKSCKQIVDCLIENVLNTEANTTTPQAYKRLVSSFSTLHLLSKIKPENFINHAETLLPYLNIKSTVNIYLYKWYHFERCQFLGNFFIT